MCVASVGHLDQIFVGSNFLEYSDLSGSSESQDENRCFPCGMVVDKEIIAKICFLIRGIEREGYLSSCLVGGCRATQGAVTTAVRKEGLLLCCCTCRLAFWARQSGLQ